MAEPWKEYQSQAEDGPWSQYSTTPPATSQQEPARSSITRRLLGDTSVDLARGIVGAGEAAVGLADIPTFGGAGKALEAIGFRPADAKEGLAQLYSPERKLANQEVSQAEGFLDTAGAMLRNPSTIAGAVTESVPATLGGGAIARGVGLARHLPTIARAAIGEGAVQAGMAAEQSRQGSESGFLDARDVTAAVGSGIGTGLIGAAGGNVARRLGIGDVDTALAGGATTTAPAPGFLRRTLAGAASEGVLEEMPQSIQEQAFANFADERPIGEGVGEAAAAGLLTGAAMGGGFAAVARPQQAQTTQPTTDQAPPPAPVAPDPAGGPLSRAAHAAVVSGASAEAMAAQAAAAAPANEAAAAPGEGSTGQAETFRLPPPPWIDPQSGEVVGEPDLASAKAYVHEQLNRLEAAGEKPLNRGAWKRELGIADNLLANTVIGEVRAERAKGLRAPEERRQDVIARLRAGEPVTERDRLSLGAAETVGPRNAVRLFAEVLGTEQSAVNDLVAAIPAGSDGRRATLAVLQAAQSALRAPTEVPDGSTVDAAPEGGAVEGGRDLFASAPGQADAGGADGRDAGAVAPATAVDVPVEPAASNRVAVGETSEPQNQASRRGFVNAEAEAPAAEREARDVSDADLPGVVEPGGQVPQSEQPSVAQLRGAGNQAASSVGAKLPAVLEGRRGAPEPQAHAGPNRQRRELRAGERSLGDQEGPGEQPAQDALVDAQRGDEIAHGMGRRTGVGPVDSAVSAEQGRDVGARGVDDATSARQAAGVAAAAAEAATSPQNDLTVPSDAQREAGNFKVGRVRVNGLNVSVEFPPGVKRRADHDRALTRAYGRIRRTEAADGEHVDVFLGDRADDVSLPVFVVDQINPATGKYDEAKVVMGEESVQAARAAYLSNYPDGWKGLGAITEMTQDEFKAWVRDPKKTTRPAGKLAKAEPKKKPATRRQPAKPQLASESATPSSNDQRIAAQMVAAEIARATDARGLIGNPKQNGKPFKTVQAANRLLNSLPDPSKFGVYRENAGYVLNPVSRDTGVGALDPRWVDQAAHEQRRAENAVTMRARGGLFSKAGRAGSDRASWDGFPAAVIADPFGPTQRPLRKNPNYAAAKAGDPRAAIALVTDYLTPDVVARFRAQIGDRKPVLVPVLAEEASGRNKIPLAFAEALGQALRLKVDHGIVQSVRAHHTASGAFHRIAFQSAFDGQVQSGQEYFLLDDAITMGGTLANLRGHIEANGGVVLGAGVLTGHPNGANIALQPATAQRLRETFGNDLDTYLQEEFGFDSTRLTEGEAGHILKARTLDAVRDRIAQARDAAGRADDGPPLRSASDRDEVSAPPRAGRSASGLPIDRARALLTELTKAWGDNRPAIRLVRSAAELPADVQADPDADRIEGLYNGSPVVWLNLGRIRTEQRFAEVLAHEVIGHYGVERVVGAKEWGAIVDSIERLDRSGRGSQQLREIFAAVRSRQPAAAADRVLFAKEAIAFMAERGIRNSWVNRVVAAVRRFLRRMMPSLQWSEAEVRRLLSQADSFLQRADSPAQRRALVRQYAFSQQASPFFSALANAVDVAQGAPKKGDAKAWKGWLDGAQRRGEFRQAERDWLGIDAFLEGNGTTTREQLAEFVRGNQLQVEDVVLGAPENAEAGDPATLFAALSQAVIDVQGDLSFEDSSAIDEWIAGEMEDADLSRQIGVDMATIERLKASNAPSAAAYDKYQLPGGENYRELLLTLPVEDDRGTSFTLRNPETGGTVGAFGSEAEAEAFRASRADLRQHDIIGESAQSRPTQFRSSHFEHPNILAHVRFNERTDADGQRVLFLEEIQSDWHQEGRKKGYIPPQGPPLDAAITAAERHNEQMRRQFGMRSAEYEAALSRLAQLRNARNGGGTGTGVPDAPFKNTDEWAMLAFKRMVRWAVDNGFDRIAWTTGEQQAERYQLSKEVDRIEYTRDPSDRFHITAIRNGRTVVERGGLNLSEVESLLGKEMAKKLDRGEGTVEQRKSAVSKTPYEVRAISGEALNVGGEGMRAFYDKILPAAVNKWARKLDGRVGETRIAYGEKYDYFKAPAGHYAVTHGNAVVATVATEQEAVEAIKNLKAAAGTAVHALDITPTMREAATAGLPLFSKAPADVLADITAVMDANQREGVVERARAVLRDLVPAKAKDQFRSTWLGALTTRHLTELGQDYFKNIRLYSDFLSEMGADRNQLQQEGEAIAERARKWAGKHRAQARQLFDLMHDSTIDGVDPAEEYKPLQFRYSGQLHDVTPKNVKEALAAIREQIRGRSGDNKKDMLAEAKTLRGMPAREKRRREKYPGLVERWNQLSPEAQQIYREFRDAYRSRSDAIEAALVQRIRDTDVPEGHKRKIIAVIRQQFETQRLQGVYFPLQRFGRYFVAAEREGTPTFLMFDRLSDLEGAVRDLKRRGFTITAQGLKNAGKAHDAPSGTFVAQVIQSLHNAGVSEQTQDEIYQLYLQTLPELSMRKHAIHRQAVPGFDPDAVRAFAFNMNHGSHQLARLRYGHKLQDVLTLLKQQQDAARKEAGADTRKIAAGDAILGELEKRHEWIQNPQDSQATSLVSSFGFTYYLGLTPAAALVNLTQTPLVSFPYLASRYGAVKAMNHLLSGMRDSIRTGGEMQKVLTDPDEQRAHAYLLKSGALDKSLAHNLAGIAEGGLAGYNPGWARAMEIVGWGFHKAEVVNREATGLAAFRMAKEAGASFDAAVRVAVDAIVQTHFDYSNANRARFMQAGWAKVLLMFRQYSLNMTWHLGRMVWNATKGESAEVKKIARRNLAGVLGMTALFSGTMGLPLLSVTMGVLNAIAASFGDPDEPWDAETEFRAFLADMLGDSVASLVLSGAANAATGADIASRVSLNQLWFRDADRQLDGRGAYYHLLEQAAGPMGGVLKNALVGKQLIDEGHLWRGVETTLPKALKDMLRGARYAREGVNTLRGDPLIPDASVRDTLLQLAGFTPAKVADRYDTNRSLKNYEGFILDRRSRLIDAFAMANRLNDAEAKRETLVRIRAFNRANPEVAITPDTIRRSLGQRARYSARAESGITLDRRLARRVREAVGD